jgi:hypothetical protein
MRIIRVVLASGQGQEVMAEGVTLAINDEGRYVLVLGRWGRGLERVEIPVRNASASFLTHALIGSSAEGRIVLESEPQDETPGALVLLTAQTLWRIDQRSEEVKELACGYIFAPGLGCRMGRARIAERLLWLAPGTCVGCSTTPKNSYRLLCSEQSSSSPQKKYTPFLTLERVDQRRKEALYVKP